MIMSTLDFPSEYYQNTINKTDTEKTAFIIPSGMLVFKRMCFGLLDAPSAFQKLIYMMLQSMIVKFALVYLGDIIIVRKNAERACRIFFLMERRNSVFSASICN